MMRAAYIEESELCEFLNWQIINCLFEKNMRKAASPKNTIAAAYKFLALQKKSLQCPAWFDTHTDSKNTFSKLVDFSSEWVPPTTTY